VLPADVTISGWNAALEPVAGAARPAVRLGLSLLRGMKQEVAERIENARAARAFESVHDLAQRAQLDRHDLHVLADANALSRLAGNRREALWHSVAAVPEKDMLAAAVGADDTPPLGTPTEGQNIVADYRSSGLTLRRHPLALLRARLLEKRLMPAANLNGYRNGQPARGCGIVTVRQRPGTAKGFVFLTLEDETGISNVIVRPDVYDEQRVTIVEASFVIVEGLLQQDDGVTAVRAERVQALEGLSIDVESHDFR